MIWELGITNYDFFNAKVKQKPTHSLRQSKKIQMALRKTEKTKRQTALSASKRGSCFPARMNPLASPVRSGTGGRLLYGRD